MARIATQLFADAPALERGWDAETLNNASAVVLLALGIEPARLSAFAARVPPSVPVLLADCYGIVGFSTDQGRNLELMEAGRGQEYGGPGGDGGQGVVAVVFSSGFVASPQDPPHEATSHLVVSPSGGITSYLSRNKIGPYYGGVAKQTLRLAPERGQFERVPQFFISSLPSATTGVGLTSFTGDVTAATKQLVDQMPAPLQAEAVALMPCFMRGKNNYGKNDVEPTAISKLLPGVPLFGMFCHGELGPAGCLGFGTTEPPPGNCRMHSMTSVVAVHAAQG